MDKSNEYRKKAREAQDMAERALNDTDRASWLNIARSWLMLIPQSEQTPAEKARIAEQQRSDQSEC